METHERYWEQQLKQGERAVEIAIDNLGRLALQEQMQLFETNGDIIYFPQKEEPEDFIA